MPLSIEDYWKSILSVERPSEATPIRGWTFDLTRLPTFQEAPLSISDDLSEGRDPRNCPVILVSAPGAVGKTTLAKQIAAETSAVYVDLAKADPVGGNAITGGLVKSNLFSKWQAGQTALLIDGLDEARLRVTQEAFEAFLSDVAHLARGRSLPTVIFGRTGAISEAWLFLYGKIDIAVLEIGFFDEPASIEFACSRVASRRSSSAHSTVDRKAAGLLLSGLRSQTQSDGDRFAGYAPVIQAIADQIVSEENPSALVAKIEDGSQVVTLQSVVTSICSRERSKLESLNFESKAAANALYLLDEQLDRLAAKVYGLPDPPLPSLKPNDSQTYASALETWVSEHPFLDGVSKPSSAVFDAVIACHSLKKNARGIALDKELMRGAAANPFLAEFYLETDAAPRDDRKIPPEHVGIVYASLRARLTIGETASLTIEGSDEAQDDVELLEAEVEVSVDRKDIDRTRSLRFRTEQTGQLLLGAQVEDVELNVPHANVVLGHGPELILVAPISIQCHALSILSDRVVVEHPPVPDQSAVSLEAETSETPNLASSPVLRGQARLSVSWPGSEGYPWTAFASQPTSIADPRLAEALRRFRKFIIAFRSHSKGGLRRIRHKLEHSRMTKGSGMAVLELLKSEGIIFLSGEKYELDATRLGSISGATYHDCMSRNFSTKTIFISRALH